jgi:hypothetical protein
MSLDIIGHPLRWLLFFGAMATWQGARSLQDPNPVSYLRIADSRHVARFGRTTLSAEPSLTVSFRLDDA